MDEEKNAVGRPSKYEDRFPEMLIEHFKKGFSYESFGGVVGVSKQTLYDWEKVHEEFLYAKKTGETASMLQWEKYGIDGLYSETFKDDDGMTVSRSINASIWIFNMKNRFGWRDKIESVSSESDNIPIAYLPKSKRPKATE